MYTKDWAKLWVGFMYNLKQTKCVVAGSLSPGPGWVQTKLKIVGLTFT